MRSEETRKECEEYYALAGLGIIFVVVIIFVFVGKRNEYRFIPFIVGTKGTEVMQDDVNERFDNRVYNIEEDIELTMMDVNVEKEVFSTNEIGRAFRCKDVKDLVVIIGR